MTDTPVTPAVTFRGSLEAVLPDGTRFKLTHPDVRVPVTRLVEAGRTYAQPSMFAEVLLSEFGIIGWELEAVGPASIETKQSVSLGELIERVRERLGGTKRRRSGDTVVKTKRKR